jgi:tRNA(fMet)-specific endonuclease VapC
MGGTFEVAREAPRSPRSARLYKCSEEHTRPEGCSPGEVVKLRYLLDTNMLSEPTKPAPSLVFLEYFERHAGATGIASVTWHEALYGARLLPEGKRRRAILDYLQSLAFPVLSFDSRAADWLTAPYADGQIAAIAAVNDLTLVTANRKDFTEFNSLTVVSWLHA